jgi:undecaprenyl-diphosphatase
MSLKHALVIGAIQSVALLPGVSRSGSTITGGIFAGLTREAATRFSFLLSIPALVGAGLLKVADLTEVGGYTAVEIAVGVTAAFVAGYAAIRWLVALVAHERLTGFAWYCLAAGTIGLLGVTLFGS